MSEHEIICAVFLVLLCGFAVCGLYLEGRIRALSEALSRAHYSLLSDDPAHPARTEFLMLKERGQ